MPTCRAIQSVLHNLLGTYTSRYSEYEGYWLFGFLVEKLTSLEINLLATEFSCPAAIEGIARKLAAARFADQLRKSALDRSKIREANLVIQRLPRPIVQPVNGEPSAGNWIRFEVTATMDSGQQFQAAKTLFVAPHNPQVERQSTRSS